MLTKLPGSAAVSIINNRTLFTLCFTLTYDEIPLNTLERTMKIGNETVHVTEIDWEKRNWRRILTPEEEREIAEKC
jgi:hypothetical protein